LTRILLLSCIFASAASAESIQSWTRRKNVILFTLDRGSAELEWITASTYRFERCPKLVCPGRPGLPDLIKFTLTEFPDRLEFRTDHLLVQLSKANLTITARSLRGRELLAELPASGLNYARTCSPSEQLYGLGPRIVPELNLRGQTISSIHPLLISTAGYGQFFAAASPHQFDLCLADPKRLTVKAPAADRLEYFFYYGPTPKEILEEHRAIAGPIKAISPFHVGILKPQSLPAYATRIPEMPLLETVRFLTHGAFSAFIAPAVALDQPVKALFPLTYGTGSNRLRASLKSYLFTYLQEARDRGLPMFRPIAMQYSNDPQASRYIDEFMIGDEILVASSDKLYLPPGIWTDLRDWKIHKGRQVIPIEKSEMPPAFVKNGAILPLDAPDGHIELHYFPRLGAEFFIAEPGDDLPTQVHAAPSADYLRLEIESRIDREYVWVVHHVPEAVKVEPKADFSYDPAQRTLRVPASAKQDSDIIFNITLKEPL
jgi:hypothetical protein